MSIEVVETNVLKNVEAQATSLIGVGKVRALLLNLDAGQSLNPCQMPFPVLYYVIEGKGVLRVAEEQAGLKAGSLTVVPAGAVRSIATDGHIRVLAVQSLS